MARIQVGGAGGALAINVVASLRAANRGDEIIGQSSAPVDRFLADVDAFHLVPRAIAPGYRDAILDLLARTRPRFLLATHDFEIRALSRLRDELAELEIELALPSAAAVETCVDKFRSYELWAAAGLPVPETILVRDPADLEAAMDRLVGAVWLRAVEGGGGSGALPTDSPSLARAWIAVRTAGGGSPRDASSAAARRPGNRCGGTAS